MILLALLTTAHDAEDSTTQALASDIRDARQLARETYETVSDVEGASSAHIPILVLAVVVALVVVIITAEVAAIADSDDAGGNPPPVLSPIRESTLRMPLAYPFQRHRDHWPPFEGVRVELGRGEA